MSPTYPIVNKAVYFVGAVQTMKDAVAADS